MLSMHIYYRNSPILKILGQFENLGFVIISTRVNIRLIARAPLLITSLDMMLSNKRITKALIRLRGCAGWSELLLFASPEDRFLTSRPI